MGSSRWWLLPLILLGLSGTLAQAGESLRCDDGLVRVGDGTWEVQKACGEPDYTYRQLKVSIPRVGIVGSVREWYYNRGPQKLIRLLYFREGDLARIETVGKGFTGRSDRHCDPYIFEPDMSKYEVAMICGDPDYRETRWRLRDHYAQRVDEWVYEFGSRQFPRELHFIEGRLDDVETIN